MDRGTQTLILKEEIQTMDFESIVLLHSSYTFFFFGNQVPLITKTSPCMFSGIIQTSTYITCL